MNDTQKLVPNMKYIMKQRNINVKSLAELTDISVSALRSILAGRRKGTIEQLVKISNGLGIAIQDLITRDLAEDMENSENIDEEKLEKSRAELIEEIKNLRKCDIEFMIRFIKDMYKIGK